MPPAWHDLLCPEGNQHSGALGGQGSQGLNSPQTIRENRIQSILLLPAENAHLAQVFPGCGWFSVSESSCPWYQPDGPWSRGRTSSFDPCWSDRPAFPWFPLLFHVIRQNSGEVIGGVLLPLPVGRIGFHTQELVLNFPHRFSRWEQAGCQWKA